MYVDIGHDPSAVGIILQVKKDSVHLIHHTFSVLVLHLHLIAVCLANGACFIRPAVPDVAVKIVDIVGFLLPDPEDLIHSAFQRRLPQRQRRKFFPQIIAVHHAEPLDGIGRGSVLPHRAYLLALGAGAVVNNVFAHVDKSNICRAHVLLLSYVCRNLYLYVSIRFFPELNLTFVIVP